MSREKFCLWIYAIKDETRDSFRRFWRELNHGTTYRFKSDTAF